MQGEYKLGVGDGFDALFDAIGRLGPEDQLKVRLLPVPRAASGKRATV